MLDALRSALRWTAAGAWGAVYLPPAVAIGMVEPSRGHALLRSWGRRALEGFGIELIIEDRNGGIYDEPPYLFVVLNQTSLPEAFAVTAAPPIPFRMIVNAEFAIILPLGLALAALESKIVVRQWPSQARGRIDAAIRDMKRGASYGISIEGRRSVDGALGRYKKGAAVMAIAAQARVVPVVFHGLRSCMPFGEWRVRPGNVRVVFLEAISTRGMQYGDRDRLTGTLRALAEKELSAA